MYPIFNDDYGNYFYPSEYTEEFEAYQTNAFGLPGGFSPIKQVKSTVTGAKKDEMGPMDPASMFLDPTLLKHGAAQLDVLPKEGDPTQMDVQGASSKDPKGGRVKKLGKFGIGMAKKIPGVGGVISAGEDAAGMAKGLKKGVIPSSEQVIGMVEKIPGSEKVSKAMTAVVNVGQVAAGMAQGKLPTIDQSTAILGGIPGMSDVADIANMGAKAAKGAGQMMGIIKAPPDDGKLRSCWLKSHGRGFGKIPSGMLKGKRYCNPGREMSGGLCYDKCP